MLRTGARGSGELISFAGKGLGNVWNSAPENPLRSRCDPAIGPRPGSLGWILHLLPPWPVFTDRGHSWVAGRQDWGHPHGASELSHAELT